MSVTRRHIADGAVSPRKEHTALRDQSYLYDTFNSQPWATTSLNAYGAPTGVTGDLNFLHTRKASYLYCVKGAGQTLLAPLLDAVNGGLNISQDNVASEGAEYVPGAMQSANNPFAVTIGTSPNSFIKVTARLGTVANLAEFGVGYRKAEAQQALIDDYDEAAWINVQAGVVRTETILNNGATTTATVAGVTAADGVNFTLEVRTRGRYVDFFVNGVQKQPAAALYRFDAGEVIVPFIHFLRGAGGASTVHLVLVECGRMVDVYDSLSAK